MSADVVVMSSDTDTKNPFGLTIEQLIGLVDPKSPEEYAKLGGRSGIAKALKVNLETGLVIPSHPSSNGGDAVYESQSSLLSKGNSNTQLSTGEVDNVDLRRDIFGTNALPEPISKTLLQFMLEAFKDKMLLVLIIAAFVEIGTGIYKQWFATDKDALALIDGGAILVAVLIVVLSASISDYQKQAQFRKLSDFSKGLLQIRVLRSGQVTSIPPNDLVVGDIVLLQVGDVVPADGVLVQGFNVEADESTLTGEPFAVEKDFVDDPFILSGTRIVNGVGRMVVIATGIHSMNGRSILALEVEPEETPLQQKLGRIADVIAKYGGGAALGMMGLLLIIYLSIGGYKKEQTKVISDIIGLFITAVTIVVVAVPEGLPLAVTLSLAHATKKMLLDNNLVRHLSACETMGNATTICSDKTGTLTLNKMTVVRGLITTVPFDRNDTFSEKYNTVAQKASKPLHYQKALDLIATSLNINSTAEQVQDASGNKTLTGSKTEIAILEFTAKLGFPFEQHRANSTVVEVVPFSSQKKSMATYVRRRKDIEFETSFGLDARELRYVPDSSETRDWVYVKGASEIILSRCTRYLDSNGVVQLLTSEERTKIENTIEEFAKGALRTIGSAVKPVPTRTVTDHHDKKKKKDHADAQDTTSPAESDEDGKDLIFVALFGILDPVRPEVPEAVRQCQAAGVIVRMVTGDNIVTAKAIARECGILSAEGLAMEGPDFRKLSEKEYDEILPKLQVLARSSPLDKQILVNNLKRLGNVVAVTGDGTNDAPALTSADVGFSMGIAGTEVAKEASDIVLMDDNFASLVKAVLWGRSVFDAIRKFLQFQLTVNVSAVVIAIVTSFATTVGPQQSPNSVLTAIQLLWINLVMDTFAALALATDPPTPDLLERAPQSRKEHIISAPMFKMILGQAIYQIIVCLVLFFRGSAFFHKENLPIGQLGIDDYTSTVIFNAFVFCQIFNEINCRSITHKLNIFKNIHTNYWFMSIFVITVVGQVIIVQFGNVVFKLQDGGLDGMGWLASILLGLGSLPVGVLVRLLPDFDVSFLKSSESVDELDASHEAVEMVDLKAGRTTEPLQSPVGLPKDGSEERARSNSSDRSRVLWEQAIRRTRMQLRAIKAFRVPVEPGRGGRSSVTGSDRQHKRTGSTLSRASSTRMAAIAAPGSSSAGLNATGAGRTSFERRQTAESLWSIVRNSFLSSPRRVDYTTLQMTDPSRIRQAKAAAMAKVRKQK